MKTIRVLFGIYSELYKKNPVNETDEFIYFFYSQEHVPQEPLNGKIIILSEYPSTMNKNSQNPVLLEQHAIRTALKEIRKTITDEKTRIICSSFSDVFIHEIPENCSFHENESIFFLTTVPMHVFGHEYLISTYRLMSDTYLSIRNDRLVPFSSCSKEVRADVFEKLYHNKVCDAENFLESNIPVKHLILIPSVIHTSSSNPLAYQSYRSVFTPEERLKQTIQQCKSIQKVKQPTDQILLLEASEITFSEMEQLSEVVDKIVLFSQDSVASHFANVHKNKSTYEVYVMDFINTKMTNYCWMMKVGGRYCLTSSFNFSDFEKELPAMNILNVNGNVCIEPVLYSIPFKFRLLFHEQYQKKKLELDNPRYDIEHFLRDMFSPNIHQVDHCHAVGVGAISGDTNLI